MEQAGAAAARDGGKQWETTLEQVLEQVGRRLGSGTGDLSRRIREGEAAACDALRFALARVVAGALGDAGGRVAGVYLWDEDPDEMPGLMPITLLAVCDRKTEALASLADSLAAEAGALLQPMLGDAGGGGDLSRLINVQFVEQEYVRGRRGMGAAVAGLHLPALRLWPA